MTRLDDLIHNSHMTAAHQAFFFEDSPNPVALKQSEDQITDVLKLLQTSTKVKQFLIKDLFVRAKRTLNSASKENFAKLTWNDHDSEKLVLVKTFREKVEVEAILDPMNLILLTK